MRSGTVAVKWTLAVAVIGITTALFYSWTVGQEPNDSGHHLDPESIAALVAELDRIRQEENIPAMGLALVTRDQVLYAGALGVTDLESKRPVDASSRFRIGSITKTFDGLLALRLAERGQLDLDARVDEYLEPLPYANPWAKTHPVRFSQTLEHTAGLTDMTMTEFKFSDPTTPPLATTLYLHSDQRELQWPAGLHSSYSNVGSGIAGLMMEKITGKSFETLMGEEVFTPLGLTTATVLLDEATQANLVAGYDTDGITPIRYWHVIFRPFGAINITPTDMATFIQLLLNEGEHQGQRYLPPAAIKRMEQPNTTHAARAGVSYGYGFGNYGWHRKGFLFHGHGGDGDGYLTHFGYQRDLGVGYFLVINVFRHPPLRRLRAHLEDALVSGKTPPAAIPEVKMSPAQLETLAGVYTEQSWRFGGRRERDLLHLEVAGNGLMKQLGENGRRRRLIPVGLGQFRHSNESTATVAISRDPEGDIIFQGDMGNFRKTD
jgi:CubicO group peptidase (beta-lactamase class C family)